MVEEEAKKHKKEGGENSEDDLPDDDSGDEEGGVNTAASADAYEAWKTRELERIKRDREERIKWEI